MLSQLFGNVEVRKKDGTRILGKLAFKDKYIGVFFSGHWCPPCRQFTPSLKQFYEELKGADFEVLFVTYDHSEADQLKYINEMHPNWYYVPFANPSIQVAQEKLDVVGIPKLVIFNKQGEIVSKNGRFDVTSKPPQAALAAWKKK